jgi:hypothetical protein
MDAHEIVIHHVQRDGVRVVLNLLRATGRRSRQAIRDADRLDCHSHQADAAPRGADEEQFKNWTTNFGPAYRDTVQGVSGFLPCTGQYALCFHSGPKPLPCESNVDGRFANCKCTVQTGLNFVLITAILNFEVYQDTVNVCGADGSACAAHPDKAPVCKAIARGKMIPGADVISTYSPHDESDLAKLLTQARDKPSLKICPKAPYAVSLLFCPISAFLCFFAQRASN